MNFPVSDLTSYQELIEQQGLKSQTNIISLDKIIVDIILSEKTGFSRSQQVWCLIRQRIVDGCASVVDIDYLDVRLMPQLNRSIAENSIYDYLENSSTLAFLMPLKKSPLTTLASKTKSSSISVKIITSSAYAQKFI